MRLSDNQPIAFEKHYDQKLDVATINGILNKYEIITFNGNKYDIPLLKLALTGVDCAVLKDASDKIIHENLPFYQFEREYKLNDSRFNHVDIIELCIGKASLKTYAGRLHCQKMQDLPIEPNAHIRPDQREILKEYCHNDLVNTKHLLDEIKPQLELRREMSKEYRLDLRSKSDSQIAEAVIKSEIIKTNGKIAKTEKESNFFHYDVPGFIKPSTNKLYAVLEILEKSPFSLTNSGSVEMPKELSSMKIKIGKSTYQMGIGGLHSQEKSVNHKEDAIFLLADWDVTSYYPSIILNCELFPKQLGSQFLEVYRQIVAERIYAKQVGLIVKSEALKIVLNGSFGKFGSPYSILFAPKLMIQVTITGQLALLCLIDRLEELGVNVVSANTDGIVVKCQRNREDLMKRIIKEWETVTGFNMERSDYQSLYSRDVNNYIAIKTDGKVKTKGTFVSANIKKNPQNEICSLAIIEFLTKGTPIEDTIHSCKEITKFVTLRNVQGGAVKNNVYLGKVIRWYYAKNTQGTINYKTNNNSVPKSTGANPLMQLPKEFPKDVNYDWYIKETKELLNDIGIHSIGQMNLF